jgi:oxygen-independent coproporphyrinogen III oxidase
MQGIYIHIPFCSQACHYCDFHFSTSLSSRDEMVKMICREIELRSDYLSKKNLDTIYFGGGTPSVLSPQELERIIEVIHKHFQITNDTEITIEANPDDLNKEKILELIKIGVNRLSIGIQSFHNEHLKYLHRIHSSEEAELSVKRAQDIGINNISIDLIYGIPAATHQIWIKDLEKALSLNVKHISSYCLTIEPKTVFGKWLKMSRIKNTEEEFSAFQFELLIKSMVDQGYEHYEVSNFSKPGFHSRHNSNYWLGGHYLGIGPSAHSYNGDSREYNVANNAGYIRSIREGIIPKEVENLSERDKINEYILTGVRTKWGCDFLMLEDKFKMDISSFNKILEPYTLDGYLEYKDGIAKLTSKGMLIADKITRDLFLV